MKRIILALALVFLLAATVRAEIHGSWTASRNDDGRVQLNLSYADHNHFDTPFDVAQLTGLSPAQVSAATETPVNFEMKRDPGTISFHGTFEKGDGAGHFTFTPNAQYFRTIESMGVAPGTKEQSEERLLSLAFLDVSVDFIRAMRAAGYDQTLDEYTSMRIFRVTPELIAQYHRQGFDKLPYSSLIAFRIHRVTPEYVEQMRTAGYNLSADDLVKSRIHRATPEFLSEMRAAGYPSLAFDDAIRFRIHRVTPDVIKQLRDLGYTGLTPDDLVKMSIHRVTPEYIRDLAAAGYSHIPVDKLVEMRIRGIDADMVKKLK